MGRPQGRKVPSASRLGERRSPRARPRELVGSVNKFRTECNKCATIYSRRGPDGRRAAVVASVCRGSATDERVVVRCRPRNGMTGRELAAVLRRGRGGSPSCIQWMREAVKCAASSISREAEVERSRSTARRQRRTGARSALGGRGGWQRRCGPGRRAGRGAGRGEPSDVSGPAGALRDDGGCQSPAAGSRLARGAGGRLSRTRFLRYLSRLPTEGTLPPEHPPEA